MQARYITKLVLSDIKLEISRPPRLEWRGLLRTMTSTVAVVDLNNFK
jgi:hypothetical protein